MSKKSCLMTKMWMNKSLRKICYKWSMKRRVVRWQASSEVCLKSSIKLMAGQSFTRRICSHQHLKNSTCLFKTTRLTKLSFTEFSCPTTFRCRKLSWKSRTQQPWKIKGSSSDTLLGKWHRPSHLGSLSRLSVKRGKLAQRPTWSCMNSMWINDHFHRKC